jgi:small subunit ribosomal protein S1
MGVSRRYPSNTRLFGKVTNIADYGAFVEIEPGIEGLVHVSEMDWTNKNVAPAKVVTLGEEVEVMVLEIDEDKRRISLGMKQCKANPWEEFARTTSAATRSRARSSRSPTSASSWAWPPASTAWCTCPTCPGTRPAKPPCATSRRARKSKPSCWPSTWSASASAWASSSWTATRSPASPRSTTVARTVNGKVKTVDPRGAEIQLNDDVTGYLRASELSRDRVEDARNVLKEGDEVSCMIINVDRKARSIQLSIKAKDAADQQEQMQRLAQTSERENAGTTSLGALLRAKLDSNRE